MDRWLFLMGAIAAEVFGTSALRALSRPDASWMWWIGVVGGYVSAFALLWGALSSGASLAISYAIWAGAGVAATALVAATVFGETVNVWTIVGIALVIIGVVVIELGSGHAGATR